MASFRPEPNAQQYEAVADSPVAFALGEVTACWNQAFEAMGQGDLDRVTDLLDLAEQLLAAAGSGEHDDARAAQLRRAAMVAYGRLQHAMQAGLSGLKDELARARKGHKALRGYGAERPPQGRLRGNA